jgi:hypothetical protein
MSRKETGVDIGKQRRVIEVTPLEMPEEFPSDPPTEAPVPAKTEPEPATVPAE